MWGSAVSSPSGVQQTIWCILDEVTVIRAFLAYFVCFSVPLEQAAATFTDFPIYSTAPTLYKFESCGFVVNLAWSWPPDMRTCVVTWWKCSYVLHWPMSKHFVVDVRWKVVLGSKHKPVENERKCSWKCTTVNAMYFKATSNCNNLKTVNRASKHYCNLFSISYENDTIQYSLFCLTSQLSGVTGSWLCKLLEQEITGQTPFISCRPTSRIKAWRVGLIIITCMIWRIG